MKNKILTFIMAGGKGERLFPLTRDRVKPAVPFGGIYRIIDFTLSNCINSGLRHIFLLSQYKSASLQRHIRLGWNYLPSALGQFITMLPAQQRVGQSWYLGTADAVYQNIYTLEDEKADYILILAGDHIYKMDYQDMLDLHRNNKADMTVGVVELDKEQAGSFGIVEVDNSGLVKGFQEKPKSPKVHPRDKNKVYASMGIYVFNVDALKDELNQDAHAPGSSHDFGKDIIPQMLKNKRRVHAYNFIDPDKMQPQYWRDIGTLDAYYEANMDLVSLKPEFNLYDEHWPIRTFQEHFPPAKTVFAEEDGKGRVGMVLNSLISQGCIVSGGRVQHSVLSYNVRINSYSEVVDTILMEGVNVGRYAKIRRAIIDKDVDIPQREVIGYDIEEDKKRFKVSESGIVIVAKRTQI